MQAVIGMMHPSSRLSPLQGAMGFSVSLPVVDKRARIEGPIKHSDQGQSSTGEDTASHPVLLFSCSPSEAKLLVRPANGLLSQSLENGKEPERTAGGSLWTAELREGDIAAVLEAPSRRPSLSRWGHPASKWLFQRSLCQTLQFAKFTAWLAGRERGAGNPNTEQPGGHPWMLCDGRLTRYGRSEYANTRTWVLEKPGVVIIPW